MTLPVLHLDEMTDRRAHYRNLGLPAHVENGSILLRTGTEITAMHMSSALGRPVLARTLPRSGGERWTVLCWPNRWPNQDAEDELHRAGASFCAAGSPLLLPESMRRVPGEPWWIQPPGSELPELSSVVAVTRMMARAQNAA
jgi:hypothetical protein